MGIEIGQWSEWNFNQSLDWHLLEWDRHKNMQYYFKELNAFYKANPALYINDYDPSGFEWINCNDYEGSIVSFLRKGTTESETLLVVANFTPVPRYEYKVGVPIHCDWQEIFNSDALEFGGSGVGNMGGFWSDEVKWDNKTYSLNLTLPPLGIIIFKPKIIPGKEGA
jgi:1,4-alpha-glucan branching enzyme